MKPIHPVEIAPSGSLLVEVVSKIQAALKVKIVPHFFQYTAIGTIWINTIPKMLIIGGSDAGISAALRAIEIDPKIEVTVIVADRYPTGPFLPVHL